MNTIKRNRNKVSILETVHETAKTISGTFTAEEMTKVINSQLNDSEKLTQKQVSACLSSTARYGARIQRQAQGTYIYN